MNDWQTMETAPKDRRILVYNPAEGVYATRYLDGEWPCVRTIADAAHLSESPKQWDKDDPDRERRVGTWYPAAMFWKPLPEPPPGHFGCDGKWHLPREAA